MPSSGSSGTYPGLPIVLPAAYGIIIDGGTFGDGLSHPASTNGYSTLLALQAVYPHATALSNEMAWPMIQGAVNAALAAPGRSCVRIPAGSYKINKTIAVTDGTKVRIIGDGDATVLLGQGCGSAPVISISNAYRCCPLSDLVIRGLDVPVSVGQTGGGVANTTCFVPGSRAIELTHSWGITIERLDIRNFDECTAIGATGWVWSVTFLDCWFGESNKGAVVPGARENSFERMVFERCSLANNNYGAWINMLASDGASLAGSIFFLNCAIDYNIVCAIHYEAGADDAADIQNAVYVSACHVETDANTSGTAARIMNGGNLICVGTEFYENGPNPEGLVAPQFYARTTVEACKVPGTADSYATATPVVYGAEMLDHVHVRGNTMRYGGRPLAVRNSSGDYLQPVDIPVHTTISSGDIVIAHDHQVRVIHLTHAAGSGARTITVPSNVTANLGIGTVIEFLSRSTVQFTLVAGSGATLTGSKGATLSWTNDIQMRVVLTKVGASSWYAWFSR